MLIGGLFLGLPALAGILDTPPPALGPAGTSIVVYRMGPVHYDPGHVETVIRCSNLSAATIGVAVEYFDEEDALHGAWRTETLGPRRSLIVSTGPTANAPEAEYPAGLLPMEHGKARVSATSAQIACSAEHVMLDARTGAPTKITVLELVKKVAR
jgi:hypothetical protein